MRRLATASQRPDWQEAQPRRTCYTRGQLLAAGTTALYIKSLACHDYESCLPVVVIEAVSSTLSTPAGAALRAASTDSPPRDDDVGAERRDEVRV
jgi:hypothetical protein